MFMRKRSSRLWRLLVPCVCMLLLLAMALWPAAVTEVHNEQEMLRLLEQDIRHMAVQSYALKGRYPPNLRYLEENYGLRVDRDRFIVHYQFIADNLPPKIMVFAI